jgi:hypothetical protein
MIRPEGKGEGFVFGGKIIVFGAKRNKFIKNSV